MAAWVAINGNDDLTTYADPSTALQHRTLNMVKIWWLVDFNKTQTLSAGKYYFSQKAEIEFDCSAERMRILSNFGSS